MFFFLPFAFVFVKAKIAVAASQECDKNKEKLSGIKKKKKVFRSAGWESNGAPLSCVLEAVFLLDGAKNKQSYQVQYKIRKPSSVNLESAGR